MINESMFAHRQKLVMKIDHNQESDLNSYFKEELVLVDEVIAAPSRPFKQSYVEDKQDDQSVKGAGLLLKNWTGEADKKIS